MTVLDLRDSGTTFASPEPKIGLKVRFYDIFEPSNVGAGDTVIWNSAQGEARGVVDETGWEYTPNRTHWFEVIVTEETTTNLGEPS